MQPTKSTARRKISLRELFAAGQNNTPVIILHETIWESWAKDFGSLAALCAASWVNMALIGASAINWVLVFVFVVWSLGKVGGGLDGYSVTVGELRQMLEVRNA